jgi:hypothetical protein
MTGHRLYRGLYQKGFTFEMSAWFRRAEIEHNEQFEARVAT